MTITVLNSHTFLAAVTASSNSAPYPVDYRFSGGQNRYISGTKATEDTVTVKISSDNNLTYTTATAFSDGIEFSCVLVAPCTHIQVIKSGSAGATTVTGIV